MSTEHTRDIYLAYDPNAPKDKWREVLVLSYYIVPFIQANYKNIRDNTEKEYSANIDILRADINKTAPVVFTGLDMKWLMEYFDNVSRNLFFVLRNITKVELNEWITECGLLFGNKCMIDELLKEEASALIRTATISQLRANYGWIIVTEI